MEDAASSEEESTSYSVGCTDLLRSDVIPQLFSSVPAINEASSYLVEKTSYLSNRLSSFVEDVVSGDASPRGQESGTPSPRPIADSLSHNCQISYDPSRVSNAALPNFDGPVSSSVGNSSHDTTDIVESTDSMWNGTSIFKGLISRVQKTLRGSSDDIGWLQSTPGMPPVEDGTKRFMELLDRIRNGEHKLPSSMVYLLVPGLFSNHGPLYFVNTKTSFSKQGLACHIARIHSEASVEKNAKEIKEYIEEIYWGSGKRILLFGHSKGGVDAAAALSMYWSDLKDKVAGLALAQSPYGGSPVASDILREGQLADFETRKVMELLICKVIKGDLQALEDLTYAKRREFLRNHQLPEELPVVSFHTEASTAPGVIATLSHVAHAELPRFPLPVFGTEEQAASQPTKLRVVFPLAAAMAACALNLQLRYGEKSDGLVCRRDAEVPGSMVVRPSQKMDHGWMVYSSLKDDPKEADASQVCEALLTLLVEIGQKRAHEMAQKID